MTPTLSDRMLSLEIKMDNDARDRKERQVKLDQELLDLRGSVEVTKYEIGMKISEITNKVFGNGNVEGSICWKIEKVKQDVAKLSERLDAISTVGNWRKTFLLEALRTLMIGITVGIINGIILWKMVGK